MSKAWSGGFVSCPQCAREIPDFAVACPHCGASIAALRSGYCPQCRAVVGVTAAGACAACGAETMDVRVERTVAPDAVAEVLAGVSHPADTRSKTQPAVSDSQEPPPSDIPPRRKRSWLVWAIPLACLVLAGTAVGIYFGVAGNGDNATSGTATSMAGGASADATSTTVLAVDAWTKLEPTGDTPVARHGHSMAYDANSGLVVLFGGVGDGARDDTWAYDSAKNTWKNLDPRGAVPHVRLEHSMVFDPDTRRVILFGGCAEACFDDTWAYDSAANTWTDLQPAGQVPAARRGHSMVSEAATGRVILFGGSNRDESVYFNDTWAYEPENNIWVNLNPTGDVPPARSGHSMAFDSDSGRVILFGGHDTDPYQDTWAYDPIANTWSNLQPERNAEPPGIRLNHSIVYDSVTGRVILFGGLNPGLPADLNDTWAYDPYLNTWTELDPTGDLPEARESHSMVYDPVTGKVILFGGMVSSESGENSFGDTWIFGD